MASWFTDSLKRMESMLEKVDQQAAVTIQTLDANTPTGTPQKAREDPHGYDQPYTPSSVLRSGHTSSPASRPSPVPTRDTKKRDEDIFKFLNDGEPPQITPPPILFPVSTPPPSSSSNSLPGSAGAKQKKAPSKREPSSTGKTQKPRATNTKNTPSSSEATAVAAPDKNNQVTEDTESRTPTKPPHTPEPRRRTSLTPPETSHAHEHEHIAPIPIKVDEDEQPVLKGDDGASPLQDLPLIPPPQDEEDHKENREQDLATPEEPTHTHHHYHDEQQKEETLDTHTQPNIHLEDRHDTENHTESEEVQTNHDDDDHLEHNDTVDGNDDDYDDDVAHEVEEEEAVDNNEDEAALEYQRQAQAQADAFAQLNSQYQQQYTQAAQLSRENQLLRAEVVKLHDEMLALSDKGRATAEALANATQAMSEHQRISHERERHITKLQQMERDYEAAIAAKDMQQTSLRNQLETAVHQLSSRDATLATLQDTVESLIRERDAAQASGQTKASEAEALVLQEREAKESLARTRKDAEARMQSEIAELGLALGQAQRSLEERTLELQRQTTQLKEVQVEAKTVRQELVDYKLRASKVLQGKEKLIQDMTEKMQSGGTDTGGARGAERTADMLAMQQERDQLAQDKADLEEMVEQLRANLMDMQSQVESETEYLRTQLSTSEDQVEAERRRFQAMQMETVARQAEVSSLREELAKRTEELREANQHREADVQKLKRQLAVKALSSATQQELEGRLQTMTDHLQQKQAEINTLTSEKSYLTLQIESLVQRGGDAGQAAPHTTLTVRGSGSHMKTSGDEEDDDDGYAGSNSSVVHDDVWSSKLRQRSIASIMPASVVTVDSAVGKKVVGAAQFLDRVAASTGRTLRRSPYARLGTIFYVVLLHLWVFYIFVSWNPETHMDGYATPGPPTPHQRAEPATPQ
eukprot:TRINITY_DN180_c0_g1_i4.p1 TRINITY_DN180_c0_g1~~TRINITY_DN180_c0_g1_i4.p1  ORF type:complete len:925 (-),score=281.30 TRINITY_DN180_c0_g1_i4:46-2820(-)